MNPKLALYGCLTALLMTLSAAKPALAGDAPTTLAKAVPTPPPGVTMTVIAIASDPPGEIRAAPGGGRVLTPAVIYAPSVGENVRSPAIVMVSRGPGSNPGQAADPARWAAEQFAAMGYTVMSVQSHMDRGYNLFPFAESAFEIDAALTALEARGYEDFVLAGGGYGAIAAAHYVVSSPDKSLDKEGERRVQAVLLFDAVTSLRDYPGLSLATDYETVMTRARAAFAQGDNAYPANRTMEIAPGFTKGADRVGSGNFVASAEAMLDFWGPEAAVRNEAALRSLPVPALALVSTIERSVSQAELESAKAAAKSAFEIARFPTALSDSRNDVLATASSWLEKQGVGLRPRVRERLVDTVTTDGTVLSAMLYEPEVVDPHRPAILMAHGRAGDMIQSSTHWMGWRLAQKGYVVLAPSLRISGLAGIQTSNRKEVVEDLMNWMDRFAALGRRHVVATGHSNGGIWISDYKAVTQDPRVIGMVYLAPTANVATWDERKADAASYKAYLAAKAAVEEGRGSEQTFGIQSATLVYDSLRPENPSHPERMSQFDVPGLAIIGSEDGLFQRPGVRERLKAGYKGPYTELLYEGGSHGFRESKDRLVGDIDTWLRKTFPPGKP